MQTIKANRSVPAVVIATIAVAPREALVVPIAADHALVAQAGIAVDRAPGGVGREALVVRAVKAVVARVVVKDKGGQMTAGRLTGIARRSLLRHRPM
jgi:hypothetical protein